MIFISFNMCCNSKEKLGLFLENIQSTAKNPEEIEIVLKIDSEDKKLLTYVKDIRSSYKMAIVVITGPKGKGYFELWKWLNVLLQNTSPEAYFVCNSFDEMSFTTQYWDEILKRYKGLFKDDLFRLRTSIFKYRNYHDIWEPGYAPDSTAFYTKKWLDTVGYWNACHGPDSYQQYVAYYLSKANFPSKNQYMRDIPVPEIDIDGQGASHGLRKKEARLRVSDGWRAWDRLLSHKIQQDCNQKAHLLIARIYQEERMLTDKTVVEIGHPYIKLRHKITNEIIEQWKFTLSRSYFFFLWLKRFPYVSYYCGGTPAQKGSFFKGLLEILKSRNYYYMRAIKEFIIKYKIDVYIFLLNAPRILLKKGAIRIQKASEFLERLDQISETDNLNAKNIKFFFQTLNKDVDDTAEFLESILITKKNNNKDLDLIKKINKDIFNEKIIKNKENEQKEEELNVTKNLF